MKQERVVLSCFSFTILGGILTNADFRNTLCAYLKNQGSAKILKINSQKAYKWMILILSNSSTAELTGKLSEYQDRNADL